MLYHKSLDSDTRLESYGYFIETLNRESWSRLNTLIDSEKQTCYILDDRYVRSWVTRVRQQSLEQSHVILSSVPSLTSHMRGFTGDAIISMIVYTYRIPEISERVYNVW